MAISLSISARDSKVSMLLSLVLVRITIFSCNFFFVLFLVVGNNFFIILVAKENIIVNAAFFITTGAKRTFAWEIVQTCPVVALKI